MSQPMNAAEYRAQAAKVKAEGPTEIVTLKSGTVFELRRPDLMGYVTTGRLPQSLLVEALKAWQKKNVASPDALATQLNEKEAIDSLILMREVVHDACVKPKFVEIATEDDEIGAADMLPDDFNEIFEWAMTHQGVTGLDGLKSFRAGRKKGTGNRTHKSKQRLPSEQLVKA